jgi:DNA-binding beta-propeller fold protein YncE
VSCDRPYRDDEGAGQVLRWEYHFARFPEQHGYDVTYASNLDFERHVGLLNGIGMFVHGGHDEYWTPQQREQVDQALASGQMSLGHFGGNGAYWRVRMLSSSEGRPLRTLVCYRNAVERAPLPGRTVRFRDEPDPHPENALFGTQYDGWQLIPFPLVVSSPSHWLFAGTGLTRGTQLHGLLGYEFDRTMDNGFTPPGLQTSMDSPVVTAEGVPSRSQVVDRTLPSGRLVFSAGTIYWPLALSEDPELHDSRVARMTLNVLERGLAHRRAPRTLASASGPVPRQPEPRAVWASRVEALAGQEGPGGFRDGAGAQALFLGPTGVAVTPLGQVVVADTGNNRIRLIDVDRERTVRTLAGNGLPGLRDGEGEQAMFRRPTGVAVGPEGAIYVADSDNHNIRRLEQDGTGWRVSTYAGGMRQAGYRDGPAEDARFRRPTALAMDALGNLYVADQAGNRIRMVTAGTRQVVTVAGTGRAGFADSPSGLQAIFNNPSALSVGPAGELYVLDANQRVRRVSADAVRSVTTLAGRERGPLGFADGRGDEARFRAQMGMAVTASGEVLLADTANYRIRKLVPGKDAATSQVYTLAGSGLLGTRLGTGDVADIVAPTGLAVAPNGSVVISDSGNNVVRVMVRQRPSP